MFSFSHAFDFYLILMSCSGVILGIMWGAMPGLSTTMAMALLVGLTYGIPTDAAVSFMLGTFTGSVYGGVISAILINIPGTSDAVPTMIAGFPLAKRGQAGLVLGVTITVSMISYWAGYFLLVVGAPFVIDIALKFSSWEVGLLAIWGVAVTGTLTVDEAPVKGWISGWLGLLIALVGREAIFGVERFSFGILDLSQGISYLPVLIGLFGLTEIFVVLSEPSPYLMPQKIGKVFPALGLIIRYWKSIIRSVIIGLIVGVMPGAGADVACWFSYKLGERVTKRNFADGDMEGVICSEAADKAELGGALLPTLTLGIPGSAPAAAFLAALAVHGIVVGPTIDVRHPGFLSFIYGTLAVCNVALYFLAFALIKPCVKLFSLRREILLPIIAVIGVAASFAEKMEMFDIYLVLGFGLVGYAMRKAHFPIGPMILGIILGPMMDENLRRAMVVLKGETLWQILYGRPIGTLMIVVIIITFITGLSTKKKTVEA